MFKKYGEIEIGATPGLEDAAQVGCADYAVQSTRECREFKSQILRHYPIPAGADAGVRIVSFRHELGSYREVCVAYSLGDEKAQEWAISVEADAKAALQSWDEVAMENLGLKVA